jgi:hypothetical protein
LKWIFKKRMKEKENISNCLCQLPHVTKRASNEERVTSLPPKDIPGMSPRMLPQAGLQGIFMLPAPCPIWATLQNYTRGVFPCCIGELETGATWKAHAGNTL